MYLGTCDGWCPRSYIEEMEHKCDDIKSVKWTDAPHAFVLHNKDNVEVAKVCAEWIREDMKSE